MRKILLAMGVAALLACGGQAAKADQQDNDWTQKFDLHLKDLDRLMQGVDEFLQSIPRYQAPIIDENGDIIIRRAPRERGFDPFRQPVEPEFADI